MQLRPGQSGGGQSGPPTVSECLLVRHRPRYGFSEHTGLVEQASSRVPAIPSMRPSYTGTRSALQALLQFLVHVDPRAALHVLMTIYDGYSLKRRQRPITVEIPIHPRRKNGALSADLITQV